MPRLGWLVNANLFGALGPTNFPLFSQRVPQLLLARFHLALSLIAKEDRAQLVALVVAGNEFSFRVRPAQINSRRLHAEITDEVQSQIEHLRPEVGDLLVANPFLSRHVCARD
jgi:hypothetical protein